MAELLLKLKRDADPATAYEDGDLLCAFSTRRIKAVHAEMICHPVKEGFTSDGLRAADSLGRFLLERVHEYRYDRVSATAITCTRLATSEVEVLSATPNAKGEHIHVEEYVRRQVAHARHRVFGVPGAEFWFGGTTTWNDAKLTEIWAAIEARTGLLEINHRKWPLTPHELREFGAVPTDDFTEPTATDLVAPLLDADGVTMLKKRKHYAPYRDLLSRPRVQRWLDRNQTVDLRDEIDPLSLALLDRLKVI